MTQSMTRTTISGRTGAKGDQVHVVNRSGPDVRRRKRALVRRLLILVVLVVGQLALVQGLSGADNIVTDNDNNVNNDYESNGCINPDTPCLPDGLPHYYFVGNLGPSMRTAVSNTMNNSYGTVVNVESRDTGTVESTTDLGFWYDNDGSGGGDPLPATTFGLYRCMSRVTGSDPPRCNHAHVTFNNLIGGGASPFLNFNAAELQKLACHETGHSFGLTHPSNAGYANNNNPTGCMLQGRSTWYPLNGPSGSHNSDHL